MNPLHAHARPRAYTTRQNLRNQRHTPTALAPTQVAQVLVAALSQPAAADKVVEIVSNPSAPQLPQDQWFAV